MFSQYILTSLKNIKSHPGLKTRSDVHSQNTRCRTKVDVPRVQLAASRNAFPISVMSFLNKLPLSVSRLPPKQFVAVVTELINSRPYYSIKEFMEDVLTLLLGFYIVLNILTLSIPIWVKGEEDGTW